MCPAGSSLSGWQRGGPKRRALEVPGPKDVAVGAVTAVVFTGCLARIWGVGEAGSAPGDLGDLVSGGDAGMILQQWVLFPNRAGLLSCGDAPGCPSIHRGGLIPTSPPRPGLGDLSLGDQPPLCPRSPPGRAVCVSPIPSGQEQSGSVPAPCQYWIFRCGHPSPAAQTGLS